MPTKLPDEIAKILREHGFGPDACWDCHGKWIVYHRTLEQIAVRAGIAFDPPMVIEANGTAKSVAICVTGHLGDMSIWSIGEAAPHNNKNTYPYAMAEKRAVDRVVLKLIGLHGLAYSEEEADDFKGTAPQQDAEPADARPQYVEQAHARIQGSHTKTDLQAWWEGEAQRRRQLNLTPDQVGELKQAVTAKLATFAKEAA